MYKWLKIFIVVFALALGSDVFAQTTDVADTEGVMRSSGKIFVVLAIVLTILAGLILYVVRLDRKISKLEKGDI